MMKVVRVKNARGEDSLLGIDQPEVTEEVHADLIRELKRSRPRQVGEPVPFEDV